MQMTASKMIVPVTVPITIDTVSDVSVKKQDVSVKLDKWFMQISVFFMVAVRKHHFCKVKVNQKWKTPLKLVDT